MAKKWLITSTVDSDGDGLMDANDSEPIVKREIQTVSVGYSGEIISSINGIDWISRKTGTEDYSDIAYGNNTFVAVGDSGTILTSSDGISWTSRTSGSSVRFMGITFGNGMFVVVGENGTILTSYDGITWTSRNSEHHSGFYKLLTGKIFL